MTWNACTIAFAAALLAHRGIETALDALQLRHLRRRRDRVPAHLEGKVDLETIRRAARYGAEKVRLAIVGRWTEAAALVALVAFGFAALDRAAAALSDGPVVRGLAFFALLGLALAALRLPLDVYAIFSTEARYGFNRRTARGFAADLARALAIGAVLGGALLAPVLWLVGAAGGWLFTALGFACFAAVQLVVAWLYPVAIMPLYNRLAPVEGELAGDVRALAARVGFPLRGVVSMDGSRRSSHVNAFIVGLRGARRIVLYDTLVGKLSRAELLAVVAHELGHFRLGHVRRRIAAALAVLLAAFAALGAALDEPALPVGLGFEGASAHATLAAVFVFASEVAFPVLFVGRVLSRRQEHAADRFAVDATGGGEALSAALVALAKQNLASPGSARAYRVYHNTHPSLRERLAAIAAHAAEEAPAPLS